MESGAARAPVVMSPTVLPTVAAGIRGAVPEAAWGMLERFAARCPPGSRGWAAAAAGILEASAAKPGNVHPGASFTDLCYEDLVAAAIAMAAELDAAPHRPLGHTIRAAVAASVAVTRSNANLGIVLLTAPLAAADLGGPLTPASVAHVLARATAADATDIYAAIALAAPGGLGRSHRWDIHAAPPRDILAAMHEARDRDQIARLWALGYEPLVRGPVGDLAAEVAAGASLHDAVVRTYLRQLARAPDSHVARRHGPAVAAHVSARAATVLAAGDDWRAEAAAFDRELRSSGTDNPGTVNPGSTADLVAAAVYILLRDPAAGSPPP
jgi:triphosphoribosyl-dephospho-CoA synthase